MARQRPPEPAFEIDLHGSTVESAMRRLSQELYTCRARGQTPVLVITGRGLGSAGGKPIVRRHVEAWLRGAEGKRAGVIQCQSANKEGAFRVDLAPPGAGSG